MSFLRTGGVPGFQEDVNIFLAKAKGLSRIDFVMSRYGQVFLDKSEANSLKIIVGV